MPIKAIVGCARDRIQHWLKAVGSLFLHNLGVLGVTGCLRLAAPCQSVVRHRASPNYYANYSLPLT
jgi:hypothetical protein